MGGSTGEYAAAMVNSKEKTTAHFGTSRADPDIFGPELLSKTTRTHEKNQSKDKFDTPEPEGLFRPVWGHAREAEQCLHLWRPTNAFECVRIVQCPIAQYKNQLCFSTP